MQVTLYNCTNKQKHNWFFKVSENETFLYQHTETVYSHV